MKYRKSYKKRGFGSLKKRAFKRRRKFSRRRKGSKYDSNIYFQKVTAIGSLVSNVANVSSYWFDWGQQNPGNANVNSVHIGQCPEHTQALARYREYRIVGMKVKIMPQAMREPLRLDGAAPTAYKYIQGTVKVHNGGSLFDAGTSYNVLMNNTTFRTITHNRTHQFYVNIKKYWWSKGLKWIDNTLVYPTTAGSYLRSDLFAYAVNDEIGRYFVTYYVQYRYQVSG